MDLLTIAKKNLKKNFSFYSFYFISVAFVLMVLFSFISFAMNDIMMNKISSDGRVETMSKTVAIFVMGFVIFYMSYSNSFFIKKRMKELGIYSLMGYRKSSMLKLLTFENSFICFGALLAGIAMGAIAHKGIVEIIVRVLKLKVDTTIIPLINTNAVLFTLIFVFAVLFVLFFSNWNILRKSSLLTLIRMEKTQEKQIKINWILSILGLLFILLGYVLAYDITRGKESLWTTIGFSPVALLTMMSVVTGTILFIHSFLPFVIKKMMNRKRWFYKELNVIILPNFIYKIRTKAKTLILLTLLAAGTLAVFGSTVLSVYYPVLATERIVPSAIEFPVENRQLAEKAIKIVKNTHGVKHMTYKETRMIQTTSISDKLPDEYHSKDVPGFDLMSESDYKELIKSQGKKAELGILAHHDAVLVKYRPGKENLDKENVYSLDLSSGKNAEVKVKSTTLINPIGFANSVGTLIISDKLYKEIKTFGLPEKAIMSINGANMRDNKEVYKNLAPLFEDNQNFASSYQRNEMITHENSSTFLLIIFITIIFFIATGSILYFHNISSVIADKNHYTILNRMGYNKRKIKKIISKEIFTLFSIPFILGATHSIFALIAYKSALMDDLLGKSSAFIQPILFAFSIFTIVYIIYYLLTKRTCYKIVFNNKG